MTEALERDHEAIKALMEEAAISILREPVKIYLRAPSRARAAGEAYKDKDGFAINLLPALSLEELYETWLHEVGHIYHGHCDEMEPRDFSSLSLEEIAVLEAGHYLPGINQDELQSYKESDAERSADNFARAIDHVVRNRAFDIFFTTQVSVEVRVGLLKKITLEPDPKRKRMK